MQVILKKYAEKDVKHLKNDTETKQKNVVIYDTTSKEFKQHNNQQGCE